MIKRIKVCGVRATFTIARTTKVIGVNSQLEDGRHILMWDFDEVGLSEVAEALTPIQTRYFLSSIYILQTRYPNHHIAYCFTACEWRKVIEILASTRFVDLNFIKYGVYRGRFTLRVTPKNVTIPKLVLTLPGWEAANCNVDDLKLWVRYETLKR